MAGGPGDEFGSNPVRALLQGELGYSDVEQIERQRRHRTAEIPIANGTRAGPGGSLDRRSPATPAGSTTEESATAHLRDAADHAAGRDDAQPARRRRPRVVLAGAGRDDRLGSAARHPGRPAPTQSKLGTVKVVYAGDRKPAAGHPLPGHPARKPVRQPVRRSTWSSPTRSAASWSRSPGRSNPIRAPAGSPSASGTAPSCRSKTSSIEPLRGPAGAAEDAGRLRPPHDRGPAHPVDLAGRRRRRTRKLLPAHRRSRRRAPAGPKAHAAPNEPDLLGGDDQPDGQSLHPVLPEADQARRHPAAEDRSTPPCPRACSRSWPGSRSAPTRRSRPRRSERPAKPSRPPRAAPPTRRSARSTSASAPAPRPLHIPGKAYLAGPYKGAPASLAIVTPAVAGPFDLGNVVVRTALDIDPTTAQVHAVTDPIPTIVEGVPLDIRSISLELDRPELHPQPDQLQPGVGARRGHLGLRPDASPSRRPSRSATARSCPSSPR